jgi:hypothetical protein
VITYENSEEPVKCPYCNSTGLCEHLFALYDVTFNSLEGGYLLDKKGIDNILYEYFNEYIKSNGLPKKLKTVNSNLKEIWSEILQNKSEIRFNEISNQYEFDLPGSNSFIFEILDEMEVPEFGQFEGGPGQSSTYKVYYSDDPQLTYQKLKDKILHTLQSLRG